ncbi:MAG: hypothetical protein LBB67_03615 [Oscillospiraceae bacterium]|jgi:hypothetical protein|nr:hypothetical protein [Oscillospiraceae bacterium]
MPQDNQNVTQPTRFLEQEPPIAGEPHADEPSLLDQVEAILAGPPVYISSRELGDAILQYKKYIGYDADTGFARPFTVTDEIRQSNVGTLSLPQTRAPGDPNKFCTEPLIMPGNNKITAEFPSDSTRRCDAANPCSFYSIAGLGAKISIPNFFSYKMDGVVHWGFCLNYMKHYLTGPFGNVDISNAIPETRLIQLAVSFAIANAPTSPFDAATGADFFDVFDASGCAGLNGFDAYAVVQAVVWALIEQVDINDVVFTENISTCTTPPCAIDKFPCLKTAANNLYAMAIAYGTGNLDCGDASAGSSGGSSASGNCACVNCGSNKRDGCSDPGGLRLGCQIGDIFCCNTDSAVTDQSDTYLTFVGCPNDLRECCGRVLIGPFKLASSNTGNPDISLTPCDGCQGADITLTDYCCKTLEEPVRIGQEFYITFRPPCCKYCFDLCAEMATTSVAVYYFKSQDAAAQAMGGPVPTEERKKTCIHICIDLTPPQPNPLPPPEGGDRLLEHILINNNNNNNNNNSNANNNNSNVSSLLTNLLNKLLGGMESGFWMYPPFPPPYPPQPPYPAYPPPYPPAPSPPLEPHTPVCLHPVFDPRTGARLPNACMATSVGGFHGADACDLCHACFDRPIHLLACQGAPLPVPCVVQPPPPMLPNASMVYESNETPQRNIPTVYNPVTVVLPANVQTVVSDCKPYQPFDEQSLPPLLPETSAAPRPPWNEDTPYDACYQGW